MDSFLPPPFLPDRLIRGGHLQTLASLRSTSLEIEPRERFVVNLPDGDAIVLHENVPVDGGDGRGRVIVLFHGLSGCYGAPYMVRLAHQFANSGWTVYRVDMRGCGAARELACGLSHAGRSEDVHAALEFVARRQPDVPIGAIGVSLGGNQLLRFVGRVGADQEPQPDWFDRLRRIAVVAPPIDLVRCSENMQRFSRRVYNYYFIRNLFDSVAPGVRRREQFQQAAARGRPKTLLELDDRLTAPLSGFADAEEYYRLCGASKVARLNPVPTLVLAAEDDPIVPVDCFTRLSWPSATNLVVTKTGGHAGFAARRRQNWMDQCLVSWMNRL